jgi:hypothetical protein
MPVGNQQVEGDICPDGRRPNSSSLNRGAAGVVEHDKLAVEDAKTCPFGNRSSTPSKRFILYVMTKAFLHHAQHGRLLPLGT